MDRWYLCTVTIFVSTRLNFFKIIFRKKMLSIVWILYFYSIIISWNRFFKSIIIIISYIDLFLFLAIIILIRISCFRSISLNCFSILDNWRIFFNYDIWVINNLLNLWLILLIFLFELFPKIYRLNSGLRVGLGLWLFLNYRLMNIRGVYYIRTLYSLFRLIRRLKSYFWFRLILMMIWKCLFIIIIRRKILSILNI